MLTSLLEQSTVTLAAERPLPPLGRTGGAAVAALVFLWLALGWLTWVRWGDVTRDCGREMYVPAALALGQTLYLDVWYPYGPVAPYLNGWLFRLFGVHLFVLYSAGLLALVGSALALFFAARHLASDAAAFTAGVVVLAQAFPPGLFNFPLPYSYAAVYGALLGSLFLWLVVRTARRASTLELVGAGLCAGLAVVTKLEYGLPYSVALGLLVAGRALRVRSWTRFGTDAVAILPGVALSAAVVLWMISLRGIEFLTQENLTTWPTSYFMRRYGRHWLAQTGLAFTAESVLRAAALSVGVVAFWLAVRLWVEPSRPGVSPWPGRRIVALVGSAALIALLATRPQGARYLLERVGFPRSMLSLEMLLMPFAAWAFWRVRSGPALARLVAACFAVLLALRIGLNMVPLNEAIYYDGPALVVFLTVLEMLGLPRTGATPPRLPALVSWIPALAVLLAAVSMLIPRYQSDRSWTVLNTERGPVAIAEQQASAYAEAIAWMRESAGRGQWTMSVPEDTSLYFLSGTLAPTRVFQFLPGVLAPGKMTDEVIRAIDGLPVQYLILSNRRFPEYGAARFGIDFDRPLGAYIASHYRAVRQFAVNQNPAGAHAWQAWLWERVPSALPGPSAR